MKWLLSILLCLWTYSLQAASPTYDIPPSTRFTLPRHDSPSPLVYYFTPPDTTNNILTPYPILVLCEGSSSPGDLTSVFFIRAYFSARIQPLQVGYLTVEQWGIDGNTIDEEEFWPHYSRSQRLRDHLTVIHHLEQHPPPGWNGKLIFIGVSEGGPLVTDLSILCPNTLATINWVGAGDWSWADEFWQFFAHREQQPYWVRPSDLPPTRAAFDALIPEIIANPTPYRWMGGMTWGYHADAFQRPPIDYSHIRAPFLVVAGTEDSTIASCDQFVRQAQEAGAPVTYFRIDGMDHYIRKRPDVIDRSFEWLQLFLH